MSGESSSHRKEYIVVFVVLAILTLLEIWVAEVIDRDLQFQARLWALVGLAVAKAGAVGVYYMHLNSETNWLRFIALCPVIMGLYVYALAYEVIYR